MRLQTVTINGVDAETDLATLLALSREFPFVEWGMALSERQYPDDSYSLTRLDSFVTRARDRIGLTGQVRDGWARLICEGNIPPALDIAAFQRLQIDMTGFFRQEICDINKMLKVLPLDAAYVLPVGGDLYRDLVTVRFLEAMGMNIGMLLDYFSDESNGLTTPLAPPAGLSCGYQLGYMSESITRQLTTLDQLTHDEPIWLEICDGLLSDDGPGLNWGKVGECLGVLAGYV